MLEYYDMMQYLKSELKNEETVRENIELDILKLRNLAIEAEQLGLFEKAIESYLQEIELRNSSGNLFYKNVKFPIQKIICLYRKLKQPAALKNFLLDIMNNYPNSHQKTNWLLLYRKL